MCDSGVHVISCLDNYIMEVIDASLPLQDQTGANNPILCLRSIHWKNINQDYGVVEVSFSGRGGSDPDAYAVVLKRKLDLYYVVVAKFAAGTSAGRPRTFAKHDEKDVYSRRGHQKKRIIRFYETSKSLCAREMQGHL
ncbi:hypothetical protein ZEAMMB73_Zm00001d021552 [Zea mays]|uniref:Uncharacterized protein n=1 Tax=Zea mays TaxID=4577 RepID=A0A1D6IC36_MAIZE|nr:hypothetical protein ZEAMMB73_Zm00001d021552 [Zea mays]